jgi:hypothetical protein
MSTTQQNMLLTKFERFHRTNPMIYDMFKRFATRLRERGARRASAWLIMNRIRWEVNVETYGDDFKICNNYFALYARLFVTEHPEQLGFFKFKQMKDGNEPSVEWLRALLRPAAGA